MRCLEGEDIGPDLLLELVELEKGSFGEGGLNQWTLPPFLRYGRVYILENGSVVVGLAVILRSWGARDTAFIFSLEIEERLRGKGMGGFLLESIITSLGKEGIKRLELTVDPSNTAALRLYERKGFTHVETLRDFYGKGKNRLLMRLEIDSKEEV